MSILKSILYHLLRFKFSTLYFFYKEKVVVNAVFIPNGMSLMHTNWGDDINMVLPQLISGKKVIPYNLLFKWLQERINENILCAGSIIQWNSNSRGIIWGSGIISHDAQIKEKPLKVMAVRGPLTRRFLLDNDIDCPEIYGDPALLLPRYYAPVVEKKFSIGIIPHVVDSNEEIVSSISHMLNATIIDIKNYNCDWRHFINRVLECNFILSSSLHGLIISEAYGIPCKWVQFTDKIIGNGFKFQDFYLSIGKKDEFPLIIGKKTITSEDITRMENAWEPGTINTDALLNVCPFK